MKHNTSILMAIHRVIISGMILFLAATPTVFAADKQTVLTVAFPNALYKEFLEEAGRRFEKNHPGAAIRYMTPAASHSDHLARTLRLAVTNSLQDVSFQGYHQISVLVRKGIGISLDRLIAGEKDWSANGLTKASVDACKVGNQVYGLPFESSIPTVFFNEALVRQAGGDPDNLPEDWDGIIRLAEKISGLGKHIIGGHYDYTASGNWNFQALITSQGGRLMNRDETEIEFNGARGRRALEIIQRLGRTGMVDMSQAQVLQAFGSGQIGMLTQSNKFLKKLETSADGRFSIRTLRWPLSSENGRVPIGGRSMMMLTTDPEKQKLAWAYMKFIASPEMQTLLAKMTSATPVNMIAIREPHYLGRYYRENPNEQRAIEAISSVTGWFTFPGDNSEKIVKVIRDHLRNVAISRTDVDTTLTEMSRDVKDLLPR